MTTRIEVEIVEEIPDRLAPLTLYISFEYATAMHLCVCGCGNEVVTPLAPTDWSIKFNGGFTLHPSVGNWSFPCQSHYLIINQEIVWARKWSREQVDRNRTRDTVEKAAFYGESVRPRQVDSGRPFWRRFTVRNRRDN